jgi:hypothetical protein
MDYMEYIRKIRSSSLSYKAKLVAIMIASHYNFKTAVPAFPSVDTLAEETGLSGRSVSRAKIELIENGWLVTHRQFNRASLSVPTCPGGELNTHINTHINIKEKDSNESFDSIDNIYQEDVELLFVKEKEMTPAEVDRMLSW